MTKLVFIRSSNLALLALIAVFVVPVLLDNSWHEVQASRRFPIGKVFFCGGTLENPVVVKSTKNTDDIILSTAKARKTIFRSQKKAAAKFQKLKRLGANKKLVKKAKTGYKQWKKVRTNFELCQNGGLVDAASEINISSTKNHHWIKPVSLKQLEGVASSGMVKFTAHSKKTSNSAYCALRHFPGSIPRSGKHSAGTYLDAELECEFSRFYEKAYFFINLLAVSERFDQFASHTISETSKKNHRRKTGSDFVFEACGSEKFSCETADIWARAVKSSESYAVLTIEVYQNKSKTKLLDTFSGRLENVLNLVPATSNL